MKPYILVAILINCIYHGYALEERQARTFSLFNVVKFRNTACQATSSATLMGTCYTAQECSDKGGTSDGNCASSFGVCCVIRKSTCASAAQENNTFLESPSFPATLPVASAGGCAYTVTPSNPTDICQIRLDFTVTVLNQPTLVANGVCGTDTLTILGGATPTNAIGLIPPVLCGTLTGQHLYVDSGKAATAASITFAVPVPTTQQWRIKVSQIECGSKYAPPNGCLQYFMGNGGTVTSFNWDGTNQCVTGCLIHNQDYAVCFRQEKGMCGIQFAETTVALPLDAFHLTTGAAGLAIATTAAAANCAMAFVGIQATGLASWQTGDIYCGNFLSPVPADPVNMAEPPSACLNMAALGAAVPSYVTPFELRVWVGSNTAAVPVPQNAVTGFSIDFTLLPC